MAERVASLFVDVSANTAPFTSGMAQVKTSLTSVAGDISKFSGSVGSSFVSALQRGNAAQQTFTNNMLKAGQAAGMNTAQLSAMARSSGVFTTSQIRAATAAQNLSNRAEVLAQAVKNGSMSAAEAGRQFAQYAQQTSAAAGNTTSLAGAIGKTIGVLTALGAAAYAAGAAINAAMDFGYLGGQVIATESSFNNLLTTLGGSPTTLKQMQAATRNTVSELDLMNSTNTLLIGTSGELGQALSQASPRLAELAQAAHDVNPALGTTTFLYDSLARGIKRASPLILDNLGIIVKLGQEYDTYAASLGKTSEQLTAEEKSMAVLNAVLREGNTIISQSKAVNTEYTTSVEQMKTAVTDAKNELATSFAPAVTVVAKAVSQSARSMQFSATDVETAMKQAAQTAWTSSKSYDEYAGAVMGAAKSMGYITGSLDGLVQAGILVSREGYNMARSMDAIYGSAEELSGGLSRLDARANGWADSVSNLNGGLSGLGENIGAVTEATNISAEAIDAWAGRSAQGTEFTYASADAMDYANQRIQGMTRYYAELEAAEQRRVATAGLLAGVQGVLGDATDKYASTLETLSERETEINEKIAEASLQYGIHSEQVAELNQALQENSEAQANALSGLQNLTAEMIYQQAAAGLDTQAALDMARAMGVLSEQDYVVASSVQALREQFDTTRDGMITAAEGADEFASQIAAITQAAQNLQAKNLPVTFENLTKELNEMAKTEAPQQLEDIGTAAEPGERGLSDVSGAASDAAGNLADSAASAADTAGALNEDASAGPKAASGIAQAAGAASRAIQPLRDAERAASDLASALSNIKSPGMIRVSVTGVDSAIAELNRLKGAIAEVPTQITINASVKSSTTSNNNNQQPNMPNTGLYTTTVPQSGGGTIENYYIYNPLAAAMLVQQKQAATQQRLEAVMNG